MVNDHSDSERKPAAANWANLSRVLLYAPSPKQDSTYKGFCYFCCGALAATISSLEVNSSSYSRHSWVVLFTL